MIFLPFVANSFTCRPLLIMPHLLLYSADPVLSEELVMRRVIGIVYKINRSSSHLNTFLADNTIILAPLLRPGVRSKRRVIPYEWSGGAVYIVRFSTKTPNHLLHAELSAASQKRESTNRARNSSPTCGSDMADRRPLSDLILPYISDQQIWLDP